MRSEKDKHGESENGECFFWLASRRFFDCGASERRSNFAKECFFPFFAEKKKLTLFIFLSILFSFSERKEFFFLSPLAIL